jgi:multiple antibiotic resistance protein
MTLHWPLAGEVVPFSLVALSSVFFTVDPVASIPAFLAMGAHSSADRNRRIAKRAAWTCGLVLTVFASTGSLIFTLFGITPLGVPMLAGPGAISAVIVLVGQSKHWWQVIPVFLVILLTSIVTFYVLAAGACVQQRLGETGVRIMMRLMGLVLAAMAVQFVLNGISNVWPGMK